MLRTALDVGLFLVFEVIARAFFCIMYMNFFKTDFNDAYALSVFN